MSPQAISMLQRPNSLPRIHRQADKNLPFSSPRLPSLDVDVPTLDSYYIEHLITLSVGSSLLCNLSSPLDKTEVSWMRSLTENQRKGQ